MATADQTPTTDSTDAETHVSTLLAECDTVEEIESLDGKTIDQTEVDGGDRIRRTRCQIVSQPGEIVNIESGDILIRLGGGRSSKIIDIGDDISSSNGMHILEEIPDEEAEPHATHLRMVREALADDRCLIAGTRTSEFANTNGADQ
jgi:hypothetical protein